MGTFDPDPSMMDPRTYDSSMLDPVMLSNMNMQNLQAFSDDVHMGTGNYSGSTYDPMDMSNSMNENGTRPDTSDLDPNTVGGGPLPAGFGVPVTQSGTSTLTEFTKRRNWSQRVLEEIKDMLYILTPDGRIVYTSPSTKTLTGYDPSELNGKFISDFIHTDDAALFVREFNESIATGNQLRFFYRFRTAENKWTIFECHGHPHLTNDVSHLEITGGPVNAAGFCRGFFMMARPYPTGNSSLLDSFIEHKIENVRLQARIAALKSEEAEEADVQAKSHYHKRPGGNNGAMTRTDSTELTALSPSQTSGGVPADVQSMPPPAKPTISNIALTREALDEANAFARPDSITDKMARYEGSSHVDSIEMFTGLRYREGERAHGISTGGTSPALIRGDAGIDIPADKTDPRYGGGGYLDKKPKKVKSADEYVCTDCGTLDSPEWRRGPSGPKTLCNACGLRWAKKEKKRGGGGETGTSGSGGGGTTGTTGAGHGGNTVSSGGQSGGGGGGGGEGGNNAAAGGVPGLQPQNSSESV
jgi:PAS domain S-box-containing protein